MTRCRYLAAGYICLNRGLTQTGMGSVIEIFVRTYKFDAILGGSEEILADLGVRQAIVRFITQKNFPNAML